MRLSSAGPVRLPSRWHSDYGLRGEVAGFNTVIPGKIQIVAALALVLAGAPSVGQAKSQATKTGFGVVAGVQQAVKLAIPFQFLAVGGQALFVPFLAVALDDGNRSPGAASTSSTATQTR